MTVYPSIECSRCNSEVIPTWAETKDGNLVSDELRLECGCMILEIGRYDDISVPDFWRRADDGEKTKV